jgi:transcriptional regulator with XRE-family HTH domain
MPAAAPPVPPSSARQLVALGQQLRAERKRQKVSAIATAEAAGMSRVTLYRIEHGEPSTTIGAWHAAAAALGLRFELAGPAAQQNQAATLPDRIELADFPQLQQLAWQMKKTGELTPQEALAIYERNWRHVDRQALTMREIALVNALALIVGGGRPLV